MNFIYFFLSEFEGINTVFSFLTRLGNRYVVAAVHVAHAGVITLCRELIYFREAHFIICPGISFLAVFKLTMEFALVVSKENPFGWFPVWRIGKFVALELDGILQYFLKKKLDYIF